MTTFTKNETLINNIVAWIKNYATHAGMKSLVVGISGGIDSSVVSTLCCKTGLPTYAVSLPLHNSNQHKELSQVHGRFLQAFFSNVNHITLPLEVPYNAFQNSLSTLLPNIPITEHAFANLKSRLRMVSLYSIAQSKQGLVVGTGNRIEDFGVGFYTKYGDGGVDISPIADLYKSEVYSIAKTLELDLSIQEAEPSDGLWNDARTDQSQLQYDYDTLETVMKLHENGEYPTDELKDAYNKYSKYHNENKHKMQPIPVYKVNRDRGIDEDAFNGA